TEVQERLRLRAFTLRVAEEEGWNVAAKIPKPIPSEGDEFKDLLVEARKQAKPKEEYSTPYNRRTWQTKGTLEEPEMEVLGGAHLAMKELARKAKVLAKESVSPFYKATSEKYWRIYEKFCKRFHVDVEDPQEDDVLAFIMW
ncbi:9235_t:CDS:2, partial [Racocetra fulgida]